MANTFKLDKEFKAIVCREVETNVYTRSIETRQIADLAEGDVLIEVHYSSLNYKDSLVAKGHKGISRLYPRTPGVDAAGIVVESHSPQFKVGDNVIVTGHDLGMNTDGGFAEYVSIPAEWLIHLPENMTLKEAMIYGTAGITAGICLIELLKHNIEAGKDKVIVTGATGGVGTLSIALLANLGFEVIASTGKLDKSDWIKSIGASEVLHRSEVYDESLKALLPKRWKGAIDTVGGNTLSTVIRSTDSHGAVCVLGNVESVKLEITVFPFLMRGVTLIGIDSAERGLEIKKELWQKFANEWKIKDLDNIYKEVSLEELNERELDTINAGQQVGKVLVRIKE